MLGTKEVQWASPFGTCVETIQSGVHSSLNDTNKNIPAHIEAAKMTKLYISKTTKAFTNENGRLGVWIKVYLDDQLVSLVEVVASWVQVKNSRSYELFSVPVLIANKSHAPLLPDLDNDNASSSCKWNWKQILEAN